MPRHEGAIHTVIVHGQRSKVPILGDVLCPLAEALGIGKCIGV